MAVFNELESESRQLCSNRRGIVCPDCGKYEETTAFRIEREIPGFIQMDVQSGHQCPKMRPPPSADGGGTFTLGLQLPLHIRCELAE